MKYPLGKKFGCQDVRGLLQIAKELQMNVVGIWYDTFSGEVNNPSSITEVKNQFVTFFPFCLNQTLFFKTEFPPYHLFDSLSHFPLRV